MRRPRGRKRSIVSLHRLASAGRVVAFAYIIVMVASVSTPQPATQSAPTCHEWRECQRLALETYARRDYEQFHDLAWRAVQTGPPRNTDLLYLLARAQSLSGRPHDALVLLGRLAAMGFVGDAASDDDFRAVRQLRQWGELDAAPASAAPPPPAASPAIVRPPTVPAPTVPVPTVPAPAAASTTVSSPVALSRAMQDALRIPGVALGPAGLAYDRASSRFIVADGGQRKLMVIDERLGHVVDLVTSASAGFYHITGLEIDPLRGDLWVVSAEPGEPAADKSPASALHKLQLVSGRPLDRVPCPVDLQPCRLQDVAVTRDGGVLVLDTIGNRLLRWRASNHEFTTVATLRVSRPTSLAPAGNRIVYVAHESGIARVDTSSGAVDSLTASRDVPLGGFERIRWARDSLVGVQRLPDGSQRAVRIKVVGRAARLEIIDGSIAAADRSLATASGDEFYLLVHLPGGDAGEVIIRRSVVR